MITTFVPKLLTFMGWDHELKLYYEILGEAEAGADGRTNEHYGEGMGLSPELVRRALARLEAAGLVEIPSGRRKAREMLVCTEPPVAFLEQVLAQRMGDCDLVLPEGALVHVLESTAAPSDREQAVAWWAAQLVFHFGPRYAVLPRPAQTSNLNRGKIRVLGSPGLGGDRNIAVMRYPGGRCAVEWADVQANLLDVWRAREPVKAKARKRDYSKANELSTAYVYWPTASLPVDPHFPDVRQVLDRWNDLFGTKYALNWDVFIPIRQRLVEGQMPLAELLSAALGARRSEYWSTRANPATFFKQHSRVQELAAAGAKHDPHQRFQGASTQTEDVAF